MKKTVFCTALLAATLFAGKQDDMNLLNQQIMDLQEKNTKLQTEIKTLQVENTKLMASNKELQDKFTAINLSVAGKDNEIKQLRESVQALRLQVAASTPTKAPDTIRVAAKQPEVVVPKTLQLLVPQFPLQAELIKDPVMQDGSSIVVLVSFYNGSNKSLSGFTGTMQFHQNGTVLLECAVNFTKPVKSGESVTWYGAVPYDQSIPGNVKFSNSKAESIQVLFDANSVTLSDGSVQKVK